MAPSSKSASSTISPVGLELTKGYTIGPKIGAGAFGSVHSVIVASAAASSQHRWACKLTPVPPPKKTKSKKKPTEADVAFLRLWSENMLYANHVRHLCGSLLPKISNTRALYFHDDLQGFRCLIMERMQAEFFTALPAMVKSYRDTKVIPLGIVAERLFDIVEEFHKTLHILIDIKPENIMIDEMWGTDGRTGTVALADSLRLVDLGLVKPYRDGYGHKNNDGVGQVQGTPLYCSHNVHCLETPSRRDDAHAMLLLVGDLVLTVTSLVQKEVLGHSNVPVYHNDESYLPWSNAASDTLMGRCKDEMVTDRYSAYYSPMDAAAATILYECDTLIRPCSYAGAPDIAGVRKKLAQLQVAVPAKKARTKPAPKPKSKKASAKPAPSSSTGRRTRASAARDRDEEASTMSVESSDPDSPSLGTTSTTAAATSRRTTSRRPPSPVRPTRRRKSSDTRYRFSTAAKNSDGDGDDDDDSAEYMSCDDDDGTGTHNDNDEEVDDTMSVEEDVTPPPAKASKKTAGTNAKSGKMCGMKLLITGKGFVETETVYLVKGSIESIVIGADPESIDDSDMFTFDNASLAANHAFFVLNELGSNTCGVAVTPLSSDGPVYFGKTKVAKSGSTAFAGQTVKLGDLVVSVRSMKQADYKDAKDENRKPAATNSNQQSKKSTEKKAAKKKTAKKTKVKSARVRFTTTNEEYLLEEKSNEVLIVGSAPSRKGTPVTVANDAAVAANHVKLELQVHRDGTVMVKVMDLKAPGGTRVNGKLVPSGKYDMAISTTTVQIGGTVFTVL